MKAMVYTNYGPPEVLKLKEIEKPAPKGDEVLVKILAASANAADWHLLRGDPFLMRLSFGVFKPKYPVLGADIAGLVEAVGPDVTQFRPGDAVFGDVSGCGWGGFAEYVCAREGGLVLKPAALTFEQAAAAPMASVTALQALRTKGQIQPGHKVLINGASGGVGTFAIQIAKALGAEVTGVCSPRNLERARQLGADHVIDYTKEDFASNGQRYDLIIGANGDRSLGEYRRALAPGGRYVMTGGSMRQIFQAMLLGPVMSTGGRKLGNLMAQPNQNDLGFVKELLESGKVVPVIERQYALSEVPEALRYLEAGHAQGKIVISV